MNVLDELTKKLNHVPKNAAAYPERSERIYSGGLTYVSEHMGLLTVCAR